MVISLLQASFPRALQNDRRGKFPFSLGPKVGSRGAASPQLHVAEGDSFQIIPKRSCNTGSPTIRSWWPAAELGRFHSKTAINYEVVRSVSGFINHCEAQVPKNRSGSFHSNVCPPKSGAERLPSTQTRLISSFPLFFRSPAELAFADDRTDGSATGQIRYGGRRPDAGLSKVSRK